MDINFSDPSAREFYQEYQHDDSLEARMLRKQGIFRKLIRVFYKPVTVHVGSWSW